MAAVPQGWGKAVRRNQKIEKGKYVKMQVILPFKYTKNVYP